MVEKQVKLALELEDILSKPLEQKVNDLVRIAFLNYESISKIGEELHGNGKKGICEVIRSQGRSLAFLWTAFCTVAGAIIGVLYSHLVQ